MSVPLCYKVTISDLSNKEFTAYVIKDVVADGYIMGEGVRYFHTLEGVRYEIVMSAGIVVKFDKEREQIIRANENKE